MTVEWVMERYSRVSCYKCGLIFYMSEDFNQRRLEDHKTFWCPSGHGQYYTAETDAEKYKNLYEKEQACCLVKSKKLRAANAEAEHLTRSVNGYRGKIASMVKRSATTDTERDSHG